MTQDSASADSTMETSVNIMLRLLGSFIVVILGGVLGIVGANKEPSKLKPIVLGFLTVICGFILFPLSNYIAAVIYLIAGLLLILAGLTTKQQVEKKQLISALVFMGIVLLLTICGYFMLNNDSSVKSDEIAIEEVKPSSKEIKVKEINEFVDNIESREDWTDIIEQEVFDGEGLAAYYFQNGVVERIIVTFYGEESWVTQEYYVSNNNLVYFLMQRDNMDNELYGNKEEEKCYFDSNKLFHITNSENKSFTESELREQEEWILTTYEALTSF